MKCPQCGKFCSNVTATVNGLDEVVKVEGTCKTHGTVDLTNGEWSWDDFYPEGDV